MSDQEILFEVKDWAAWLTLNREYRRNALSPEMIDLLHQYLDQVADDENVRVVCLAGVGGRVSGIMKTTEAAAKVLAIDGCPLNCARGCLEQAGFSGFEHLQLADLGMTKGSTAVTGANIAAAADAGAELLA